MQCCPNCGNKEIENVTTDGKEVYCPPCDKTFKEAEGKKIKAQPTNRITQLEQNVGEIGKVVKGIVDTLKPKPQDGNGSFDWGQEREDKK